MVVALKERLGPLGVWIAKPDARMFAAACALLGVPADAVLHAGDDLRNDVEGSLSAGLRAAWVHRELDGEAPPNALVVRDLAALADHLDRA